MIDRIAPRFCRYEPLRSRPVDGRGWSRAWIARIAGRSPNTAARPPRRPAAPAVEGEMGWSDRVDRQRVSSPLRRPAPCHPPHRHDPAGLVAPATTTPIPSPADPTTDDANTNDHELRLQYSASRDGQAFHTAPTSCRCADGDQTERSQAVVGGYGRPRRIVACMRNNGAAYPHPDGDEPGGITDRRRRRSRHCRCDAAALAKAQTLCHSSVSDPG